MIYIVDFKYLMYAWLSYLKMIETYRNIVYNDSKEGDDRMNSYEAEQKIEEEYRDCRLVYDLNEQSDFYWESNRKNYEKMRDALDAVGVLLEVADGKLSLSIYAPDYYKTTTRKAGRRAKVAWIKEELEKGNYELYKYSDIVYMSQTLKDQEIADKIGMPIATYYRHKKKMKESDYYKSLDLNRLRDKEYLDNVPWNLTF